MIKLKNGPITLEVDESNELYSSLKKFEGEEFTVVLGDSKPTIHQVRANKEDDFLEMLQARGDGQEIKITEKDEEELERVSYKPKMYYERFFDVFGRYEEDEVPPTVYTILYSHLEYYVPKHLEVAQDDMSVNKSTDDLAAIRTRNNGSISYVSIPRELIINEGS